MSGVIDQLASHGPVQHAVWLSPGVRLSTAAKFHQGVYWMLVIFSRIGNLLQKSHFPPLLFRSPHPSFARSARPARHISSLFLRSMIFSLNHIVNQGAHISRSHVHISLATSRHAQVDKAATLNLRNWFHSLISDCLGRGKLLCRPLNSPKAWIR